jgi:hypothetical protein
LATLAYATVLFLLRPEFHYHGYRLAILCGEVDLSLEANRPYKAILMKRKEIKSKTITQSNDATSINCKRGKIKRAKRHSSKKLRQELRKENAEGRQDEADEVR